MTTCVCYLFLSPALRCIRTYVAELTTVHELKRAPDAPRTVRGSAGQDRRPFRLATMGKRTLTNIIFPFHVIPRALTTTLARTPGGNDDCRPCRIRAHRGGGVSDPCYIRPHTTCSRAHMGLLLFVVYQHVLAICERGDARLWRNFCKDSHSWMAWMGTHGRNKRGSWRQLTKPLTTQVVVVVVIKKTWTKSAYSFFVLAHGTT